MSDMMPLVEMTSVCSDCRLPLHDLHDGRSVCPACRAVWPCHMLADGVSLILDGDEAVGYLPDDDETRRLACVQVSRQAEDYATQHQPTLPEHLKDADLMLIAAFGAGAVWQWKRDHPTIGALRNEAYVKGRTAPPCKEQAEAVAQYLCSAEDWNQLNSVERGAYRATAWELLEIAGKTVSDPSRKQRKKEEK